MSKPRKYKRESLAETLVNAFFPPRYDPPPGRKPTYLPGWSGLPTDPKPEGWTEPPQQWNPSSWS